LRWRSAGSAWLASAGEGWQIGADGLLARRAVGSGVMLWSQIDPQSCLLMRRRISASHAGARRVRCRRFWRTLGASFANDEQFFSPRAEEKPVIVAVAGEWRGEADPTSARLAVTRIKVTQTPA
jgi:hypothetical protein